mmetsp:Transcript_20232/g.31603  ORF Transcript_20232/g.31603 Transcript_20232/m.31603 type:complete len:638 (-) Transcript_20232:15-1928(-)
MDPQLDNARSYVALVKETLGAGTAQYSNFLTILKGYRTGEIAVYDVIDQISELFSGDSELILGFNTFLPEDYKIELPSDDERGGTDAEEDESNEENNKKMPAKKMARIPHSVIVSIKRRRLVHQIPKNRVTSSTRVLLSPLTSKRQPTDLLYDYDPLADITFTAYPPQHDVVCKICNGATDSVATSHNELVLLCDQKGCNAEYHLGCLPSSLVSKTNSGERDVPEGDIYCKSCAEDGATTVLEKYFDRVDYARSYYSCSRAYVISLLENQMRANPEGNRLRGEEKNGDDDLNCPPRSELWGAFELKNNLTLDGKNDGDSEKSATPSSAGAAFLVGKPVRLYNNLDNEYHVGRIVDWRSCAAYPDFTASEPSASDENTVSIDDLEYFGTGIISTCEFLVRFPAGVNGRRRELLKWIVLEEHSLAVGIWLIEGKSSKTWTPAMVLARTSLELIPVRKHLHEDDSGALFAKLKDKTKSGQQCWALASFFGQETFALLDLNNEARDLMSNCKSDEDPNGREKQLGNTGPLPRHPLASVSAPLALALGERDEQQRCEEWNNTVLHDSKHPLALVACDEYCTQLKKEGKASLPIELGIDRVWLATLARKQNQTFHESKDAMMSVKYEPVGSVSKAMALLQSRR